MRCNGFCLALDNEATERAERAATGIDRFRREVKVVRGLGGASVVGLALEGQGLPVVHGFLGSEYCSLDKGEGGLIASRDALGTRPLFVAKSKRLIASDHRFVQGEDPELLPPGASLNIGNWRTDVDILKPARFEGDLGEAATILADLIGDAVRRRVRGRKMVAVAFSGGLDSSVVAICASKHSQVVACSASARGSVDATIARETADALNLEYASATLDRTGVKEELKKMELPFNPTDMDRALWCVYSKVSQVAREAGAELVMLGQLADELFGGYAKYERALVGRGPEAAASMMAADVRDCGVRGFLRDELACSRWVEPSFPFADRRVAEFGLSLPVELKISAGVRKAVLREAAVRLGVPEVVAMRQKKAAQYSSGVLKLLR
jgi:asparagine synthase (glutamine-hydrolysing)